MAKKLSISIFLALFLLIISGGFIFAQRDLEVPLPGIGGEPSITKTPLLPDYVKYIFNFAIGISGLIVFSALVYGGFRYLTSAGNPSKMSDANSQIFSALLGLVLLLGSWLLLTTINPQLVNINPTLKPCLLDTGEPCRAGGFPGVYLCKNKDSLTSTTDCQVFTEPMNNIGALDDKVGYIRFINPEGIVYGAVLHENNNYEGTCGIFTREEEVRLPNAPEGRPSSITVFRQRAGNGGTGATIYEDNEYGRGYYDFGIGENRDLGPPPPNPAPLLYKNCTPGGGFLGIGGRTCLLENTISSIRVNSGYVAVLFGDDNLGGRCQVFTGNNPALSDDYIGSDQVSSIRVLPAQ